MSGSQALPPLPTDSGWCSVVSRSLQFLEAEEVRAAGRASHAQLLGCWPQQLFSAISVGWHPLCRGACGRVDVLPLKFRVPTEGPTFGTALMCSAGVLPREVGRPGRSSLVLFLFSETIMFLHQIFYQGLKARISSWPTLVLGE